MTLKLKYTNLDISFMRINSAADSAFMLKAAERTAPVNVHSHGRQINDLIWSLESALEAAKAFRSEVEGR